MVYVTDELTNKERVAEAKKFIKQSMEVRKLKKDLSFEETLAIGIVFIFLLFAIVFSVFALFGIYLI
jgi:hypothetical protein